MIKHSVVISGHSTSISLEEEFWQQLKEIAAARKIPLNALIAEVDNERDCNLCSALRLFVLNELKKQLAEVRI